jgi:tetratricopeptide (TPR) repeat protein
VDNSDPYKVLKVGRRASRKEVEASYRFLSSQLSSLSEKERRNVDRAYMVLGDPSRREEYDRRRGYRLHPGLNAGSPDEARRHFSMGLRASEDGSWHRAYHAFRWAAFLQPWQAEYRSYLGLAAALSGRDLRRARELCRTALQLDPESDICRRNLAQVYEKLGFQMRARRVLKKDGL